MKRIRTYVVQDSDLQVTQLEDGQLEIRENILDKDGQPTYFRYGLHPGEYYGDKDPRVQVVAQRVHTPEVIIKYETALVERDRAQR